MTRTSLQMGAMTSFTNRFLPVTALLLAGCIQLPPLPEDAVAKRFEPVPDRAVIYLVRPALDRHFAAPVVLDDQFIGSTYKDTYLRMEVPAGLHRLRGYAGDSAAIDLQTLPGQIYFVQQTARGYRSFTGSSFQLVDERYGRAMVEAGQLNIWFRR